MKRWLILPFLFALTTASAQKPSVDYAVGVCPGSAQGYITLAKKVAKLNAQTKGVEDSLRKYLTEWSRTEKLPRYQVAIRFPDQRTRYWRSSPQSPANLFNASVSAAAGRNLDEAPTPGDNQRCFFRDTTVVLDTLRIRLGDFKPDNRFYVTYNQQRYTVPLNEARTELLLHAGLLPGAPVGRHLPITVTLDGTDERWPVILYVLSPDDRAQLIRSLRVWTTTAPPACDELPDMLVAHLTQNWGGKQCASPTLYNYAQRQVIKTLLRTENITCTP